MRRHTRVRVLIGVLAAVTVLGLFPAAAVGAPAIRETVSDPVVGPDVEGDSASIVRTDSGISARVHAKGLTSGNAYTAWFVVFDGGICTDTGPPFSGIGIVLNMAGHVVKGGGTATFAGQLSAGPIGAPNGADILFAAPDGIFHNPLDACVDIHIVNHGPAADYPKDVPFPCGLEDPVGVNDAINTICGTQGVVQQWTFEKA